MTFISTAQAAKLFGVSPRTINLWVKRQTLPAIKIHHTTRILVDQFPEDLKRLLFSQSAEGIGGDDAVNALQGINSIAVS